MKRFLALALTLCLMMGGAACASELSDISRALEGYWPDDTELHFSLTAELETLTPYVDETVAMMNGLLKHMSVEAKTGPDSTAFSMAVAGDPVVSLTEERTADGWQLTTPLLPNRTLTSTQELVQAEEEEPAFDLLAAIDEAEGCYQALTDAIAPYAEEKKANYKITGVGSAKWSRIARLTRDQSAELAPLIADVLCCGLDSEYRQIVQGLTYGKSFIVGLYQTGEGGNDIAVYIKGNVTLAGGGTRALSFQWAFCEGENGKRVDTWKFELGKGKKGGREIAATLKRQTGSSFLMDGQCQTMVRADSSNITHIQSYNLSGKGGKVSGKAVFTRKETDESTVETVYTPELSLTEGEGTAVLSGTVEVRQTVGKNTALAYSLRFDDQPAQALESAVENGSLYAVDEPAVIITLPESSLTQNAEVPEPPAEPEDYLVGTPPVGMTAYTAPDAVQTVDVDSLTAEEQQALMDEMSQNLAGRLLLALARLPKEDLALIRNNMYDEDFSAFLSLIDSL